ncbi:MAG: hypothetical protein HQL52_12980 [Magnetococcales bacterium]|nr:hypothetical protein [Magnetococcales bacterium]
MFVSRLGVRTERVKNKKPLVMIHRMDQKQLWVLFPDKKGYLEYPSGEMGRPPLPHEANSPCKTDPQIFCKKVGKAKIAGRLTQRWDIFTKSTEGKGKRWFASMWIDPKLKMAIREEYADGLTVALTQIQEKKQPQSLFAIPSDHTRLKSPEATAQPADSKRKK